MTNRKFVNVSIHNSEKKPTQSIFQFFLNEIRKNHFMFAFCSCLNYIFLWIFAYVIDNKRINQAWEQIP